MVDENLGQDGPADWEKDDEEMERKHPGLRKSRVKPTAEEIEVEEDEFVTRIISALSDGGGDLEWGTGSLRWGMDPDEYKKSDLRFVKKLEKSLKKLEDEKKVKVKLETKEIVDRGFYSHMYIRTAGE